MTRRLIAFALSLGLLATPALAAPPAVHVPPPPGGVINTMDGPFTVGDRYRFTSEVVQTQTGGSNAGGQTNRLTFDIEIVGVTGESLKLRYTLRSVTVSDSRVDGIELLLRAYVGVPIEFMAYPGVTPREMTNSQAMQAAYFRNLETLAPGRKDLRQTAEEAFARMSEDPDSMAGKLAGDVFVMAGMQIPAVPVGDNQLPTQNFEAGPGVKVTKTAGIAVERHAPDRCELTFSRTTLTKVQSADGGFTENLKTTATVSTRDSWVLSLSEVKLEAYDDVKTRSELKITREGGPPGCG